METLRKKYEYHKIILASASIRRQDLLKSLGLDFEVIIPDTCNEKYPKNLKSNEIAKYLAKQKSENFRILKENEILITADTIVWLDDKVLDKPADYSEAYQILKFLSGKSHEVITGVCISSIDKCIVFDSVTNVKFSNLSDEEIKYYVKNYKPYDKAGAYGIQEWLGLAGIEYINGCFYNVVGLPVQKLYRELCDF